MIFTLCDIRYSTATFGPAVSASILNIIDEEEFRILNEILYFRRRRRTPPAFIFNLIITAT